MKSLTKSLLVSVDSVPFQRRVSLTEKARGCDGHVDTRGSTENGDSQPTDCDTDQDYVAPSARVSNSGCRTSIRLGTRAAELEVPTKNRSDDDGNNLESLNRMPVSKRL